VEREQLLNVKIKFWETTLKAQWQARREIQKNNWQLKEADTKLVKAVANGLVSFAIEQLRKTKNELNNH
jgi:hypothetical protein